jgi:hypothetical protein
MIISPPSTMWLAVFSCPLQVFTENQMLDQTLLLKNAAIPNTMSTDEDDNGGFA